MKNILITGAGALLGQGMLRCLNAAKRKYNLVSVDPSVYATGHALANTAYVIPFISDPSYQERIEEIIVTENIDVILVGTDVELLFFAEKKQYLEEKYALTVVVSDSSVIAIADDKWLTAEFLRKNNFPYPTSALTTDKEKIAELLTKSNYPFIAKPIDGARSKGIEFIENDADLNRISSYKNNLVIQELLSDKEGEYTTGCVVVNKKCKAVVSLTRDLRDGNTWRAYRDDSSEYDGIIAEIAEALGVEGPVNFQYRIKNNEPVVFEINCRFSGTTPLRAQFGFNEVEALLEYYLFDKEITQPSLRNGTILRTFSDIFVANETLETFQNEGVTKAYVAQYFPFKKDE